VGESFVLWHRRHSAAGRSVPGLWTTATLPWQIFGSIFTAISVLLFALFAYEIFYVLRQVPLSAQAPLVGEKAPEFSLPDQNGESVALTDLLSPNGAVLIFYRGHW
jgi:hypothetical protein